MESISVMFRALREREGINEEVRCENNHMDVMSVLNKKNKINKKTQYKYNKSHADVATVF